MSKSGFDPINFITEVDIGCCEQVTWIAKEEGEGLPITIGGSVGEYRI